MGEQYADMQRIQNAQGQDISTETMVQLVREVPQYQELLRKYTFHLDLCEKIDFELNQEKITGPPGLFEQDLVTGVDKEGKEIKPLRYVSQLTQLLTDPNLRLGNESKLRLLLLYFCSVVNIPETSRKQLLEVANLNEKEKDVVLNLFRSGMVSMGDTQGASPGGRRGVASRRGDEGGPQAPVTHRNNKNDLKKYRMIARNARFDLTRFESRLREVGDLMVGQVLSRVAFPAMGEDVD